MSEPGILGAVVFLALMVGGPLLLLEWLSRRKKR